MRPSDSHQSLAGLPTTLAGRCEIQPVMFALAVVLVFHPRYQEELEA
jgi:hypothetical protein